MQPRFMPHLEDPADSLVAAGVETDANIALAWSDAGTVLIDTAPETSPDLSLSNQDTALADVQHHLDDDIATPAPDASAADSVSHDIQDATAPEDGGPVPVAIFSAPGNLSACVGGFGEPRSRIRRTAGCRRQHWRWRCVRGAAAC